MRFGVHLGPFWASRGGSRRRKRVRGQAARALSPAERRALERQRSEQLAEDLAAAAMSPDEYGRHLGMTEDEIARAPSS